MNGRIQGPWGRCLRAGLTIAAVIGVNALGGGVAKAASISLRSFGIARDAAAADVPASPGPVLAGVTSQGFPAFFKLTGSEKKLQFGAIALDMSCMSGATFALPDGFIHVPINAKGRLRVAVSLPITGLSGGGSLTGTDSLIGALNRKRSRFSGVWDLHLNYTSPSGQTDQCDSGLVRFVATG